MPKATLHVSIAMDLAAELAESAKREGKTISQLVSEALEAVYREQLEREKKTDRPRKA
jgi:post-segregation antitoxin (ccd killing protein)